MILPGQYFDEETALSYNYFRDYDPVTGRYVESDLIGLAGGTNTYAYVVGNPVRLIDPYGLQIAIPIDVPPPPAASGTKEPANSRPYIEEEWLKNHVSVPPQVLAFGCFASPLLCNRMLNEEADSETCPTPDTHPDDFDNIRGTKAKVNTETGEVWAPDLLHKDHWEVYRNKKRWENGERDRAVWSDGRLKEKF